MHAWRVDTRFPAPLCQHFLSSFRQPLAFQAMEASPTNMDSSVTAAGMTPPDGAEQQPWRSIPGKILCSNIVCFRASRGVRALHYLEMFNQQGFRDILSLQFCTKGECRVTFSSSESRIQAMAKGFLLHDRHVFPTPCDGLPTIQIHVHDVPVWVSDAVVISAVSPYGKLVGPLCHGQKKLQSGSIIATGVRFATFELQTGKTLPRNLPSPDNAYTFRIYREREPPTCTHCKSFTHHTDDCRCACDIVNGPP